jgi:ribosome-associated protein
MSETIIFINERLSISLTELRFRFARSGGPGGQNVNRVSTQVELLFDVKGSPSLDESQRQRLLSQLKNRIDQRGVLHIVAQSSRSQLKNRAEAIERFRELLRRALYLPQPRKPTRPRRASREKRLQEKRQRGQIKKQRSKVWHELA